MRTKQILLWALILSLAILAMGSQPARSAPAAQFPQAFQYGAGIYLTANIGSTCASTTWYSPGCAQPYAGEFVVTELNGAEVTRVMTNYVGQAAVNLPPGRYLVGVRTEDYYPYAAPLIVNVLPDRYAYVSFRLDPGQTLQALSR